MQSRAQPGHSTLTAHQRLVCRHRRTCCRCSHGHSMRTACVQLISVWCAGIVGHAAGAGLGTDWAQHTYSSSAPGVQASWDMLQEGAQAPRLWSAEEPHLYILVLSLLSPKGDVIEAESTQVCIQSFFGKLRLHWLLRLLLLTVQQRNWGM